MEEVKITPTPNGVQLAMSPPGREPIYWNVPFEGAIAFWWDWWGAISSHLPDVANPPEDEELPMIMVTGEARVKTSGQSSGLVRLQVQPYDRAGLGFEMKPAEARDLARQLLEAAETIEAYQTPN